MRRRRYGYVSRRGRHAYTAWWLVLPLTLVAGAVLISGRLPEDSGALLTASTACPAAANCDPAVVASAACATGGDCAPSRGGAVGLGALTPQQITGQAAAVIDEPCGALIYDYQSHQQRAPASLTKIATALVAFQRADLSQMVDVRVSGAGLSSATDSTVMGLEPGQRLSLRDLLFGLLLPSGNDAAIAIAEHVAGSVPAFVDLMNQEVRQLGLADTHFANPHGLDDPDLYTSAYDIAMLGRELMRRPQLAAVVATRTYQPAWDGPSLWNSNRLLQLYRGTLGVKIGYTDEAGQTIVAAAARDGRRLIVSVLGSTDVYQDAITLLDWAFERAPSACAP